MTTRTLVQRRPLVAHVSRLLAARGAEVGQLLFVVLATLLLCAALLPMGGDAPAALPSGSGEPAILLLPSTVETPPENPMWVALESWGEPHGLR